MFTNLYLKLKSTPVIRGRLRGVTTDISKKNVIPRKIYMYWNSGEDNSPELCRKCIESWRKMNPNWDVVVLNSKQANEYVDINSLPKSISQTAYSDMLRAAILNMHGGVWVDATVYCHKPLDGWIDLVTMQSGFFAFHRPGRDRVLSSWFIAASNESYLIKRWYEASIEFWKEKKEPNKIYFWFHYLFEALIVKNRKFKKEWEKVPKISATMCHYFQNCFDEDKDNELDLEKYVFMQKLSYKFDYTISDYIEFLQNK